MLKTDFQQNYYQMPDHLKCGEVYTWLCAGELYAVECKLCEDRPLCPLSEFPQHMEVWHTEWEETGKKNQKKEVTYFFDSDSEEELVGISNNDHALSFTTEDSGLFETDDQLHSTKSAKIQTEHEEILEPFEQVLIEQDLAVDTTIEISEEVNEEEYLRDVNETVAAETAQFPIENREQQMKTIVKHNLTVAKRVMVEKCLTGKESKLRHLPDTEKSSEKSGFYPAENFISNKLPYLNENLTNETESGTSGSETIYKNCTKTKKCFNKFKLKTRSIQQKYSKLNKIKRALKYIIKDLGDYKETDETESETTVTRESKNYKRNLQRQNLDNFTDSENGVTEKQINFSNKNNQLNMKRYINQLNIKKYTNHIRKFKTSRKPKKYLRKIKKNQRKNTYFTLETSLATDLEYKTAERNENETLLIKEQSESRESLTECPEAEIKSSKNTIKLNINTKVHENNWKKKQKCLIKNQKERDCNGTDIYENKVPPSEKEIEIDKNEKEINTNLKKRNVWGAKQYEIETEQTEIATKLSESITGDNVNKQKQNLKKEINVLKHKQNNAKQNADKTETIGSETSVIDLLETVQPNATNKLQSGKSKAISNVIKFNPTGTSENETTKSNHKKRLINSLDVKAKPGKYFTRNRTRNAKDNRTETRGNETLFDKKPTNPDFIEKVEDKRENLMEKIKVQDNGNFQDTKSKNKISALTSLEYLPAAMQTRRRAEKYATRILALKSKDDQAETNANKTLANDDEREKIKCKPIQNNNEIKLVSNRKETHENETRNKIFGQRIRKSQRTNCRTAKNLLKTKSRKQGKTKAKETNGNETLKSEKILKVTENETTIKSTKLETLSIAESTMANEINCETFFECKNPEGISDSETLQLKTVCSQENDITNSFSSENNIEESNGNAFLSETECLGKQNKMEYILKGNSAKQTINEREMLPSPVEKEINESETLVDHNNKTKLNEDPKTAGRSEFFSQNIRKSLRNLRKNSKYFENSLKSDGHNLKTAETDGIETHCFQKEDVGGKKLTKKLKNKDNDGGQGIEFTARPEGDKNDDTEQGIKLQRLNEFTNSTKVKKFKTNDDGNVKNSGKDKELEIDERKISENDKELTRNTLTSWEKYAEKDQQSSSKSKRIVRQRLNHLAKDKQQHSKLNGKPDNSKNLFRTRKLDCRTRYFSVKSLRSNKKVLRNLRIKTNQRYRRKTEKQTDSLTDSVVVCNNSVLTTAKNQERKNSAKEATFPREICEEIDISSEEDHQKNVLEQSKKMETIEPEGFIENIITTVNAEMNASTKESPEVNLANQRDNNIRAEENCAELDNEIEKAKLAENQSIEKSLKETLADQNENSSESKATTDTLNSSDLNSSLQHTEPIALTEPVSPVSPKPEEEYFEFNEPKEKLNKAHISHLIKLYQEHSRLWDQSHPDFCEPQLCRTSWQQITAEWNKYCQRKFTIAEVRIRICTLCQRFVQEKDRLALEGELDECAKFPYYEQMKFLEHQKSLRKRRELYEQQNEKILEIYQYFPILWHVQYYKSRQAKRRAEAFESISKVLKLFGLYLSSLGIQKRIRSLRKCYRLEKIRHLHAQVEQTAFEAEFRHYERMQFLDKHIDPFVCRICGKIYENLHGFREHLEAENHGSIVQQDTDNENTFDKDDLEENMGKSMGYSAAYSQMEYFTESENSTDILQRFTPFSATPQTTRENNYYSQNMNDLALNTAKEPSLTNSWQYDDQLIEEIMENVNNNYSFSQQGLDQFINSVTSCEELTNGNSLFEEVLSPSLLHAESSFIVEHPDIISDPNCSLMSPLTNAERLITVDFSTENSLITEHANLIADHNFSVSLASEETLVGTADPIVEKVNDLQPTEEMTGPIEVIAEKPSSSSDLLVKLQCADYSMNLKLNKDSLSMLNPHLKDSDNEVYSSGDNSTAPLPDLLIHKMIKAYRKFPQLWDPNHLDFNSRTLRRQAWVNLTTEFNSIVGKQLSWRTLHRKLTDYAKYYKKLLTEQDNSPEHLINKWAFYEDFKFLDDVIAVNTELQRSVHHRDNNFKIILTYKLFPQLWNIKHPEFSKRSCKQRNIELMCNRLQEENNLQLTTERLKNRLIELRAQYRTAKKQRLKCFKNQQQFAANEFEFYESLNFLDDHIDPFICDKCQMEFKKLTDYNQHLKKEHSPKKRIILPSAEPGVENVCHICGIKFTTRSNLQHHIKRHEGIRNYACTMCPKTFYASHALKVHTRSHTKECPYTCEKCGMSFVSASKLNQHVKRHLNKKDFECSYCPKTFFTAFEKERHERRHLNIRDKVCPICGKTFVAGSSYYAHLMLHNDKKRFECDKCDMKFAQYPGLFKHKKRHHT